MKHLVVKVVCLILVAIIMIGTVLAGCSDKPRTNNTEQVQDQKEIVLTNVDVKVIGPDGDVLADTTVSGQFKTADEALNECFNKNAIMCDGLYEGFITSVADIENTDTDGWILYVNGKVSDKGVKETKVKEGTVISLEWKNYDETYR